MKRLFLLLFSLLLVFFTHAQQVERDMVILEIGTGTWCPYCPGAAMGADDLIENGKDVAVIEYHQGDDYENSAGLSRLNYYSIPAYPTAWFDGGLQVVGGSSSQSMYSSYLPRYNNRKAINSSFAIDVTGSYAGLIDFNVDINLEKVHDYTGGTLKLHVVITESHIEKFWQGMDELNFVERMMIPNQLGTTLDFSGGNTQSFNFEFSLDPSWNAEHCEMVVFIQDNSSKEILQGTKVNLIEDLENENDYDVVSKEIIDLPANVCTGTIEPTVIIRNYGNEDLTSCEIYYQVNGEELSTYQWNGSLPFLGSDTVALPEISYVPEEVNLIKVFSGDPDGNPDQYPKNDTVVTTREKTSTPDDIGLLIRTDENPEETTWELLDGTGQVVYSGGPYTNSGEMIQEAFDLDPNECYKFNIYDAGGDGFIQPGFVYLYYGSNTTILQAFGFGHELATEFTTDMATFTEDYFTDEAEFSVYPVPTSETLNIDITMNTTSALSLRIFNLLGEELYVMEDRLNLGNQTMSIPINFLDNGIYLIQINTGESSVTRKFSVRR